MHHDDIAARIRSIAESLDYARARPNEVALTTCQDRYKVQDLQGAIRRALWSLGQLADELDLETAAERMACV